MSVKYHPLESFEMKLALSLVVFFLSYTYSEKYVRIRAVGCHSSLKSVKDQKCFIKSSKADVLLTFSANLLRKMPNSRLAYQVDRISDSAGRTNVLTLQDIPICKIFEGLSSSPFPIFKNVIDLIKKASGNLMEGCSTIGKIEMKNFTFKGFKSIVPIGFYSHQSRIFDDEDSNISSFIMNVSVVTKK